MITSWSSGAPEANMDEDILLSLGEIVVRHPWWRARAALVLALLERLAIPRSADILEAGCGWGTNLEVLEAAEEKAKAEDTRCKAIDGGIQVPDISRSTYGEK